MPALTCIIKPTLSCNARCHYCYVDDQQSRRQARIGARALTTLLDRVSQAVCSGRCERIKLLYHGGEPLLMGEPFFRRILNHKKLGDLPRGSVRHSIQTNLTDLDEPMLETLVELIGDGTVGTSVDPIPGVRTLRDSRSYLGQWHKNFHRVTSTGLEMGVLYVIHGQSLARVADVYRFFRNLGPALRGMRLNPVMPMGNAPGAQSWDVSPLDYGEFLISFWRLWDADGRPFRVRPLEDWDRLHRTGTGPLTCSESGDCSDIVAIGPDLSVYPCGRSMGARTPSLGNLADHQLDALLDSPLRPDSAFRREELTRTDCEDCPYWSLCHGGCPEVAGAGNGDRLRATPFCAGRKRFFEWCFG